MTFAIAIISIVAVIDIISPLLTGRVPTSFVSVGTEFVIKWEEFEGATTCDITKVNLKNYPYNSLNSSNLLKNQVKWPLRVLVEKKRFWRTI